MDELEAEHLVRDHIGWMMALARRMVGDHATAEDAVQDAFLSAFRAFDTLGDPTKTKAWLHRITVNASLMILRKRKRLAEQPIDHLLPEFDSNDCRIEGRWSYLARLEDVVENQHLQSVVHKSLFALPDSYRIVLQLRDIEGYETSEVADLLDISSANVKIRLHRARSALKKLLEPLLRGEIR